ncbi:hypothetical protein [Endozoicomonas lisbonensis]|uniref:Uncharacterized protein n=1 Tax=Endozoicomonas lisbonensis TaxID=3120522 RepID=A0ABV2SKT3_9GAMM
MKITNLLLPLFSLVPAASFAAFDDAGTDYSNAEQRTHVWNEALEPIELVNSILCFTKQFNGEQFANQGAYIALADESACFEQEQTGSGGQSSGASKQTKLMKAVAKVDRSDDTSPLEVGVWLPEMGKGEDGEQAIKFKATIREGVSEANPFGDFTFNFDFYDNFTENNGTGGGEVKTISGLDNKIGFTLYEQSTRQGQGGSESYKQCASVVMDADRTSGIALTGTEYSNNSDSGGRKFALAFDETRVLVQKNSGDFEDLPYKSGDFETNTKCLSRTDFEYFAHRYDLYDTTTGAKVEINSGFPIRFDGSGDGNYNGYGFVGYWGLWTEGGQALDNGNTVFRDTGGQQEEYTIVSAPGRLVKHTARSLPLGELTGIRFHYWDDAVYLDDSFDQWLVSYQNGGFYKVGKLKWQQDGPPQTTDLDSPVAISLDLTDSDHHNDSLHMFSEQLGGAVKYLAGESSVTYYEETFIDGSQVGDALLPNDGSITLTCWDNCPTGTIESGQITSWSGSGSPYEQYAPATSYSYTFSVTGNNALTLVRVSNNEPVEFGSSVNEQNLQSTPHSWGVRTGPMVLSTQTLSNPWDVYDPSIVTEYYVWETGLNNWNRLTTVRNDQGNIVSFQKPIQFSYKHSDQNDRSGNAGSFASQTIMLNYGGNGDLWGIPDVGHSSDQDYHYRPAFSIKDGVVMGPGNQYVIKAREIEELMTELPQDQCTGMVLADPAVPVPSSTTGSADIGEMPVVTGEPSVIAGVNQ